MVEYGGADRSDVAIAFAEGGEKSQTFGFGPEVSAMILFLRVDA
jgi:hypothetical protein